MLKSEAILVNILSSFFSPIYIRHKRREDSDHIFQKITSAHITAALNTVVHNPWAALYFLTHIEQMQDLVRNINANMIAGILNDQHVRQAFHTVLQDPRPEVVSLMLFRKYMNAEELRDAIYHEAITHTRGINDIALELAIAVVHAHNPRLITGPLHIGSMGGEVLHSDMAALIFNPLNAHDILQVIRAEEEYCEALELPLAKINSAMNIKAQLIIILLNASNNQYIIQALHTIMQDPQTMSFLSQNLDVVALMLFKRYMNTKELRDAIYNEATTHTIGIPDDLLELGIAAIREHHLHLIADILHIGFTCADRLLPHEIRESMLYDINSREILEVIRITGEYFDAIDPLLVKINAEENINAELITTVLNAPSDRHLIQALHGIMQDPQTMSFLSQNLDVVAYMLFRENMEAEELRDAIYNEVTTNAQGLHDAALELGITAIREHSTHLISFLCLRHIDGDRVLRPEIREAMLNSLNAHNILQILRMEEEYFDAGDQFDFEQQEQDAQIALAMNLSPELNFVSMDILLSS